MDFQKLNSYFGPMCFMDNAVQFELPSIKQYKVNEGIVTEYEYRQAKSILDAHYLTLKTDIVYEFPEASYVDVETDHRQNIVCHLDGYAELHEVEKRWNTICALETIYNENYSDGNHNWNDYFKIMYEKQDVAEEFTNAMELIERIETFINNRLENIAEDIKTRRF